MGSSLAASDGSYRRPEARHKGVDVGCAGLRPSVVWMSGCLTRRPSLFLSIHHLPSLPRLSPFQPCLAMSSPSGFAEVDPFTQQSSPASSRADDKDLTERADSPSSPSVERPSSPPPPAGPAEPSTSSAARAGASSSPSQPPYSRAYNLQQAEYAQASIARYLQGDTFTIEVRVTPLARQARIRPQSTEALLLLRCRSLMPTRRKKGPHLST